MKNLKKQKRFFAKPVLSDTNVLIMTRIPYGFLR